VSADDQIVAKNLTVRGEIDVRQDVLRFDVTSKSGQALVRDVNLPDGGVPGMGVTGMEVGDKNHGDIRFVDCHVAGFPDNGLYADPPEGRVEVLGGTFLNNGIAGVRIETANESVVRGVHVRCDDARAPARTCGASVSGAASRCSSRTAWWRCSTSRRATAR